MNNEIHIFVSEKGSAGKTTQCLSLGLYFLSKNFNTCLVDLNRGNPDLEDAFASFPTKIEIVMSEDDKPLYYRRIMPVAGKFNGKTFTLILPYRFPDTVNKIYQFLNLIYANEQATKIVVDTGENLHNFIYKHYESGRGMVESGTPELEQVKFTPTFWFTWLWSLPASINKMKRVREAVEYFKSRFTNFGDNNIVNVFNMYRIKEKVKKLNKVLTEIDRRYNSARVKPSPLSFDRIVKCVGIVAKSLGINDPSRDEIKYREIPGLWFDTFERMLETMGENGVFSNICIIEAVPKLTMFVDQIIMARPTRVSKIRSMLGKFYLIVRKFAEVHYLSERIHKKDSDPTVLVKSEKETVDKVKNEEHETRKKKSKKRKKAKEESNDVYEEIEMSISSKNE